MKLFAQLALLLFLGSSLSQFARAHPGAVADGRATCGSEYSTPDTAYHIPDIKEAWYLRRVSTCEAPVFWSKFEVESQFQPIYIAAISPEIDRFQDDLQFHGILYGPGLKPDALNGLRRIPNPSNLPAGIDFMDRDSGYITHTDFDTCDFVDTNLVMEQFSDVIEGRCMEEFTLGDSHSDPLQQETTSYSWWIYSYNHFAAMPGTYYLQTWLTPRNDTTSVAQGKYEMTLGPWTWSGYASDTTLSLAQSQGTSCSCALNALDYKEDYLERLGNLDHAFEVAQLPGGSCGAATPPESSCVTIPQQPYLTEGSAVEWSGVFELQANRNYEWTFRAYFQGPNAPVNETYAYPDPGMYVHIVPSDNMTSVSAMANNILTTTVEQEGDSPMVVVAEGEFLNLTSDKAQFILFTNTSMANSTTVLIKVISNETTSLAFFTQHVPSEFMAHVLRDKDTGDYIFPTQSTLYVDGESEQEEEPAAGPGEEPEAVEAQEKEEDPDEYEEVSRANGNDEQEDFADLIPFDGGFNLPNP